MNRAADSEDGHAQRTAANRDQVALVEHLISCARHRLAGRDEDGRELLDVRPWERIVLGVIEPKPRPLVTPLPRVPSVPLEPGVPVDHMPASEMGLTALVASDGDAFTIRVSTRFALYLQHLPTHEQQATWSGFVDKPKTLPDDGDPSSSAIIEAVQQVQPRTAGEAVPVPTDAELADLPREVAAAVQAAVRGVQAGSAGPSATGTGRGGRGPGEMLRLVYRRYDVEVDHELTVPVPLDARPHTVTEDYSYEVALRAAIAGADPTAMGRYAGSLFVPMRGNSAVRVPRAVVQSGPDAYEQHLRSRARQDWTTPLPQVSFRATIQRTPDGQLRLALTLVNDTPQPDRDHGFVPEVSMYDAGFGVSLQGARAVPSEYRVVERDYKTEPLVYAHGRFCCLDEEAYRRTGELRTTSMPLHRQVVYESRPELQPSFETLADDPVSVLDEIAGHMARYDDEWQRYLGSAPLAAQARAACEADQVAFADEMRRFNRGLTLIREDLAAGGGGIGTAFIQANQAFALMNHRGGLDNPGAPTITTWRLFQIVYIVAALPALAARELPAEALADWIAHRHQRRTADPRSSVDLDELDTADVLWFPTGGGKSAALYGLAAAAMFYDRLRGKHSGVTSIIRFPLRMLSVQQLERILRLVVACEKIRPNDAGEPFRLGYWVGKLNTPNKITDPEDQRWRDLAWMAQQSDQWLREHSVIPSCPYCGDSNVTLAPDVDRVLLQHMCRTCGKPLPVDVSDDEVYRHLPSVVVCTVDKIAALAYSSHASHLTHGPAWRCPDHGYVTHPQGRDQRCLARQRCRRNRSEWYPVTVKDPAPSLTIQDELHLLSEELGTFAAHYETLWQHLCVAGSGLPSKVLAATATISDYQNQVTQLYALRPRRFPTDGWTEGESFYAQRHPDLVRRVFVGALPTQMDVVQFSLAASEAIRSELARLTDLPGETVVKTLNLTATTPDEVHELLYRYELQCFYCNRKTEADRVHAHAERRGRDGHPPFQSVRLNGQTPLAEISDVIRRVERETSATATRDRLGSIAGTSLISHGIDLERLNILFVLGMPSTVAYYVQASSRAGRTDVGIVLTALARRHVRDRSVFHFFDPQHRYVNVLVEPVALNRFSTHGPRKTASGLLAAIITQQWARDLGSLATAQYTAPIDLTRADTTRQLLELARAAAQTGGPDPISIAQRAVKAAYGLDANVLDPQIADLFATTVEEQVANVLTSIEATHETLLTRSMRPRPPTSLRDVDASADFGAADYKATQMFHFLGGRDYDNDEADYNVAEEDE